MAKLVPLDLPKFTTAQNAPRDAIAGRERAAGTRCLVHYRLVYCQQQGLVVLPTTVLDTTRCDFGRGG
ncbi:hypothetical protein Rcae01_06503 [Novipirellula caenicola]|uniref:Uncharacterized protein n=1 Tax=Novipirellula caenicola TaxID=1536901 RepID=A0ABP9W0T3_9BACT